MKFNNVLSLFDGMSCGQLALKRSGIDVGQYMSSEIDKFAIKVTNHNYPGTIQLGDVSKIKGSELPEIDLILGGSPCQGFSFSGSRLNFDDPRSKLFFEFVRLVKECKPKYWLLENVNMKWEHVCVISKHLEVNPVKINSSLVSAQNRVRLYWANFEINQPSDKYIGLPDILDYSVPISGEMYGSVLNKGAIIGRRVNAEGKREDGNKELENVQCLEVWAVNRDKSNCLTTVDKDNVLTPLPPGRHLHAFKNKLPYRYYTMPELCRLQTVPEDYFEDSQVSENQARKMLGNGWNVDTITEILKQIPE